MLGYPESYVFEESQVSLMIRYYHTGEYFYDVQPPLVKLLITLISEFSGCQDFEFENYGRNGINDTISEGFIFLRVIPCIISAFCPVLLYCSLRVCSVSFVSSLTASIMLIFDTSSVVQGRFLIVDGIFHFFTCLHIFFFLLLHIKGSTFFALLTGISLGAATASKMNAYGLVFLVIISEIIWIMNRKPAIKRAIVSTLSILLPTFIIWFLSWVLHFSILRFKNHNLLYSNIESGYILTSRDTPESEYYGKRLIESHLIPFVIRSIYQSYRLFLRNSFPDIWESNPLYWPIVFDKFVLFYYQSESRQIICVGNLVTNWVVLFGILVTIFFLITRNIDKYNMIFLTGWLISYIPLLLLGRRMMSYNYTVPLIFAILNFSVLIDRMNIPILFEFLLSIIIIMYFFYYAPWIYGFSNDSTCYLFNSWKNGVTSDPSSIGEAAFTTKVVMGTLSLE